MTILNCDRLHQHYLVVSKMETPASFSQTQAILPPPPLSTHSSYEQPLTKSSGSFLFENPSPAYYWHVPKLAAYGSEYGSGTGKSVQSTTPCAPGDGMLPFDMSAVSNNPSVQIAGLSEQRPISMNGLMARPSSMQSVLSQDNMHASLLQGSQAFSSTMFSTVLPSPKRAADGSVGMYANESLQRSSKRPRLNMSIHSTQVDPSGSLTSQHVRQSNEVGAMSPQDSTALNSAVQDTTPMSSDGGALGVSTSANALPSTISVSTSLSGHPSLSMHGCSPQAQNPSIAQHHPFRTPSAITTPSSYDSYRHGSVSLNHLNMAYMATAQDRRLSSTTSSTAIPSPIDSYHTNAAPEGYNSLYSMRQLLDSSMMKPRHMNDGRFTLVVKQQPERARLCSFKEENDTSEHQEALLKVTLLIKPF